MLEGREGEDCGASAKRLDEEGGAGRSSRAFCITGKGLQRCRRFKKGVISGRIIAEYAGQSEYVESN
jgi:hypothetical protein